MCNSRKFRRFMALLLTIVMVLGTVGTSVSASTDYHGGSTGETSVPTWDPDNPYTGSWFTSSGTGGDSARGVRYSLVKIKKSAIATEIDSFDDYYTIGSIDVLSSELYDFYYDKYSSVAKNWLTNTELAYTTDGTYSGTPINYRRLNALDYEVGYKKEGLSFFTNTVSYCWSGTTASGNGRGIITIEQFKSAAEAIMKKYYGSDIGTHITDLESCYTNLITDFYKNTQDDALLKSVGSNGEGVDGEDGRYVYEHSELLNALVMVLSGSFIFDFDSNGNASLSWPNEWTYGQSAESFDSWFYDNIMTVEDFIAEDDEYCYRILAEPLFSAYPANASVTYLNTVRDACNLAVCQDSSTPTLANLGYTGLRGYIGKYINGYDTFAIHQTVNEFVDYDKDTYLATLNPEGTNRAEALGAAIKKWKEDNAGYVSAFYSLGSNEASYFQGLGSNGFASVMQAIFGEKTDSNATNYGSYSLGIISPFNYIDESITEEPGTITIIKEEDGTEKKLEGATFKIEDVTDPSAIVEIGEFTTDSNGEIKLDIVYYNLTVGHTYLVTESDPPTGYEKIDTPQEFTIVEDSDGNLSADPSTLTFEDPAAEGEAHLLIDYNMNGFSATVGTSGVG